MDNTVEVQDLGKVMITPKGEYNSSKTYEILDAVSYNGSSYVSKINDNTSVPTSDDWQLLSQKGDIYNVTEEDLQAIAKQITDNANGAFNQNVETKTKEFNTNATNKANDYDTNAKNTTETFDANAKKKLDEYNANDTKKLKAYNDNADSKLGAYNTNDTNKLKAYNTNADSKIEEYNTNATSKISEYDKHTEELRALAVSTDNELERVKNEILDTGSASDSFVHVEDSCMAKIKELEIEGVINQKITTGKNLLNVPKNLQQIKSDSYSITPVYSNGMLKYIELNGTFDKWVRYSILGAEFILSSGTYIQSFHKEGTFSNGSVYIDSSLSISSIESDNLSKVLSDDLNVLKYSICVNQGTICNNLKLYPMIAKEDKVSNYEPFTNGTSPNPDYPQEIRTITDSLKITSCGKNLFDKNDILESTTYLGTVGEKITTGVNTSTFAASVIKTNANSIKISSNKNDATFRVKLTDNNGIIGYNVTFTKLPQTIDTSKYQRMYVFFDKNTITTNDNIQIEIGDKETSFEEHIQSQITAKLQKDEFIGKYDETHKDTLRAEYFPEEGQYHLMLDKKIGKHVLNGSEIWKISSLSTDDYLKCYCNIYDVGLKFLYPIISSHFIYNDYRTYNGNCIAILGNDGINIGISTKVVPNIASMSTWLANNNVTAYYVLATPYTVDLGPIDMPLSYKGITNIFTDSDLLPKITAKYYRTFEKTIQNMQINEKSLKQEITDLNNNISDITKRLEALESANVSTVEESEASNDLQN